MQRVTVLCVGKLKERFYTDAAAEYVKRLQRYCKLDVVELPECRLPEEPSPAEIQRAWQTEGGGCGRGVARVEQALHFISAREPHAEADGRGEQVEIGVERVAHDGLGKRGASGNHVGKVHERAIRDPEVEVEVAKPDVTVEQQRLFAELRERHAGERGE